jgi:DNA topoisomerase-3
MTKSLIIAEKPSVASDVARVLGGFTRHDDYFENDQYVLSSAVGHLLEIGMPEAEEVKRGKWTFAHLPAIPSRFELKPIERNENRLRTLLKLIKRKDVESLINACDAGREGELIFRYIVQYAKTAKPIRRLWLQSMTPAAIRDGFGGLRTGKQMQPLADAAVCRSESDWLVGINGTRAMTAFNSRSGGFQLTTVGRVQTPTLAILVEREEKIRAFKPRAYWEVLATFRAAAGEYGGRWFDEGFRKTDDDPDRRAERLWDQAKADAIAAKCAGQPGIVTEESKPSTQGAPLLYDLTSLQREANGRFGLSARTTLSLAQSLYEKHKALTYPRTDSRALPEDYLETVSATMEALKETSAYRAVRKPGPEAEMGPAEQADLRQQQDLGSLRDHSDAGCAEAPERARGEALRFRRPAIPGRVLPGGGIHDHDAHHACGRGAVQIRRQGAGCAGLARGLRQGSAVRRGHADARRARRDRCNR